MSEWSPEKLILEQAALLSVLEPTGAPEWTRVSDIDGWALRASAKAIAHDLREPILGVRRLAAWLADLAGPEDREESMRYRELLDARLLRLEQRYDALRRFIEAGLVVGDDEEIDLHALLRRAVASSSLANTRPVELTIAGKNEPIFAPRAMLERCVEALIGNAIGHHDGAAIAIAVAIRRQPGAVRIEITDDGRGVAPGDRERVFEPFVALGAGAGAGMGLAIARRTAALRGGWCELDASEGGGTLARLIWPE